MKHKRHLFSGKVYRTLISKLFLRTMTVFGVTAVVVLILRSALRGKLADGIIALIGAIGHVDAFRADYIYQWYFRSNQEFIIFFVIVIIFLVFFWMLLTWFTKYFDQMIDGVDKLARETDDEIVLSPELKFMESKLNAVKRTLAERTETAREAEQRKNDLVVYLAHDIKTPLTSVVGYLSLLDETADLPAEAREKYTRIALEKANRLEGLINEFFEITRYNLQSVPLNRERVDFYYMMAQITDELYPQLTARGQEIKPEIPEDATVYGDAEKLARVFNNILKNAIMYSAGSEPILVSYRRTPEQTVISFRNEGTIPRNELETIFEKFYRRDAARSTASGGAGLGLAIAKDIVTLHGGTIKAESADGHTVFLVALPN